MKLVAIALFAALTSFCAATLGCVQMRTRGVPGGRASDARSICKEAPLSAEEAQELLEALPFVAADRRAGLRVDFVRGRDVNVWYEFVAEHSPAPYPQTAISGYYAVNWYTADVANVVVGPCKLERGEKLARLQKILRASHCLGPAVLKRYRDSDKYSCLQ